MDAGGRAMHGAVAERAGERRIKSHVISPLIPAPSTLLRAGFSLKGEEARHLCRYLMDRAALNFSSKLPCKL